jgi:hypothetical protein
LKAKGLVRKAGGIYGFIYRTGEKIVALDRGAYPEKLEGGEVSLTDSPSGRLEFKVESYSVNWLGWIAVGVLFGCGTD